MRPELPLYQSQKKTLKEKKLHQHSHLSSTSLINTDVKIINKY